MIVTIAYNGVSFSAGPFTDLQNCDSVVDMYGRFLVKYVETGLRLCPDCGGSASADDDKPSWKRSNTRGI